MDSQKISVETRYVELVMVNGTTISGETFIQLHGAHQVGMQRIGELINSDEDFLPVRRDGVVELVNLEQVVSIATAATEEFDPLLELATKHDIQVEPAGGSILDVRIHVDLPGGQSRVKDFLNQDKRFLHFVREDQVIYIARRKIMRVRD